MIQLVYSEAVLFSNS